jgi:hypothetical protein
MNLNREVLVTIDDARRLATSQFKL